MEKYIIGLWLVVILLTGCTNLKNHAFLEQGCTTPGVIFSSEIEEASRGYPYRFSIYLPPCYDSEADPGYPVIYLVPGGGGGVDDWFNAGVNEIADQLILMEEVPPFILVAGETTSSDTNATGIFNDLLPHIDRNFNSLQDRSYRAVAGGSLGGIAAYRLTLKYPDVFASAGLFGSGIIYGENDQVKTWLRATNSNNQPRFFINVGEQDPLSIEQAQVFLNILDEHKISYEYIVGEGDHSYAYWVTNFDTFFRWVSKDW